MLSAELEKRASGASAQAPLLPRMFFLFFPEGGGPPPESRAGLAPLSSPFFSSLLSSPLLSLRFSTSPPHLCPLRSHLLVSRPSIPPVPLLFPPPPHTPPLSSYDSTTATTTTKRRPRRSGEGLRLGPTYGPRAFSSTPCCQVRGDASEGVEGRGGGTMAGPEGLAIAFFCVLCGGPLRLGPAALHLFFPGPAPSSTRFPFRLVPIFQAPSLSPRRAWPPTEASSRTTPLPRSPPPGPPPLPTITHTPWLCRCLSPTAAATAATCTPTPTPTSNPPTPST